MPFQCYFRYIAAASALTHAVLEFYSPVLCTIFFPNHWLLSIAETMDGGERAMNFPFTNNDVSRAFFCRLQALSQTTNFLPLQIERVF